MNRLDEADSDDNCDEIPRKHAGKHILIGNKKIGKQIINHIQNMHDLNM
ncbi:hypothetical protein RWE15_05460 [Virgibacillus halophilus]|uniref:Uncharacterized protein n=2 Tax=Tigheibacillus halophilus TaxID=361280 RepID=A0ABU5C3Y7_9BACI|nr:hypothetical protein [Virgibacillus halophilus]